MTTASLTTADAHLRDAVLQQLERAPEVKDSVIDITVDDGVVTLMGVIDSHAGKRAAERVAKRVPGVWAVVNDLTVHAKVDWTDADVAADTTQAVKLRPVFQRMFR
jgi:osmotically-inducible protein OsmY